MRAAVELHVAACEPCREELNDLQEVGAAFSEFSVGEVPAQHFADYGQRIRARMARSEPGVISGAYSLRISAGQPPVRKPKNSWRVLAFGISTLAAASLAFVLSTGFLRQHPSIKLAEGKPAKKTTRVVAAKTLPQMRV